ncbi:MAG TPA: hypothetical protein VGA16_08165 [Candidatus Limnocylindria bacterium]
MRAITAVSALVLTLALGAPALAGGWAVTTLDQLPPDFRAADTYAIGYTIRQHGVTPINVESMGGTTEIQITAPDGAKTLKYRGVPDGATGHYVAKVIFPYQGAWTWQVTQGPFQAQALGTIDVLAAAGAEAPVQPAAPVAVAAPAQQQPAGPNGLLVTALLLAMAGAAVLFGSRLAVFADRRRATA